MSRNVIEQHPDKYRADLNPAYGADPKEGVPQEPIVRRTAYEINDLHELLHDWHDDDLKRVPVLPEGTRLEQGATYFDVRRPEQGELTVMGGMEAGPENWYIAKSEVDYPLWHRLLAARKP